MWVLSADRCTLVSLHSPAAFRLAEDVNQHHQVRFHDYMGEPICMFEGSKEECIAAIHNLAEEVEAVLCHPLGTDINGSLKLVEDDIPL